MATSAARRQLATRATVSSRAQEQATRRYPLLGTQPFMPLPPPRGPWPYRLELGDILPPAANEAIERAGHLRFHSVGDSGGVPDPAPQRAVAAAMVAELAGADPARFFYHLGDVVYGYGEEAGYGPQFLVPYAGYRAPILAIPGNHDGDLERGSRARSLEAFVGHFCAPEAVGVPERRAICQPNVFWTLRQRWLTIVGLYSNVPDGGRIAEDQIEWLVGELTEAPRDAVLILALRMKVKLSGRSELEVGASLLVRVTDVAKCRRQELLACRAALPFEGLKMRAPLSRPHHLFAWWLASR